MFSHYRVSLGTGHNKSKSEADYAPAGIGGVQLESFCYLGHHTQVNLISLWFIVIVLFSSFYFKIEIV